MALLAVPILPVGAMVVETAPMLAVGIFAGLLLRQSIQVAGRAGRALVADVVASLDQQDEVPFERRTTVHEPES